MSQRLGDRLFLSAAQSGVWAGQQLGPADARFNCGVCYTFEDPAPEDSAGKESPGALDVAALRRAVARAVAESETLRLRFTEEDGSPRQYVRPPGAAPEDGGHDGEWLHIVDLRRLPADAAEAEAERLMLVDLVTPLDLAEDELSKQVLYLLPGGRSQYYLRYHHILMDGYGQFLYTRRLAALYAAYATGTDPGPSPFAPLRKVLDETAAYAASPHRERDRAYWRQRLAGVGPQSGLSGADAEPAPSLLRRTVRLTDEQAAAVRTTARELGVRWSAVLIAAAALYVRRMTSEDDLVLGMGVAARTGRFALATPSMVVNNLPLRLDAPLGATFAELVGQASRELAQVVRHQRYRAEDLHADLGLAGGTELFAGPMINVFSFDADLSFGDHLPQARQLATGPVRDLMIDVYGPADGGHIRVEFEANDRAYDEAGLIRHQDRFVRYIGALLADPHRPVGHVGVWGEGELEELVVGRGGVVRGVGGVLSDLV
ncbi:condensation domain-containing protein, partial [Streptomyces badius]